MASHAPLSKTPRNAIVAALTIGCTLALGSTAAHATFTLEQIQRGLAESDALTMVKNRNQVAEKLKGADEGYVVRQGKGGDVKGMFWTCNGRVHAASALQEGSLYAFIDRVADLTRTHGKGEVTGELKTTGPGVTRTIDTVWVKGDATQKLSFTPKGTDRAEAMWFQSSVPSICTK